MLQQIKCFRKLNLALLSGETSSDFKALFGKSITRTASFAFSFSILMFLFLSKMSERLGK